MGRTTNMDRITVWLEPQEAKDVKAWAEREGKSVSEVCREVLNKARTKEGQKELARQSGVEEAIRRAIYDAVRETLTKMAGEANRAVSGALWGMFREHLDRMSDRFAALTVKSAILAGTGVYLTADLLSRQVGAEPARQLYQAARKKAVDDIKRREQEAISGSKK